MSQAATFAEALDAALSLQVQECPTVATTGLAWRPLPPGVFSLVITTAPAPRPERRKRVRLAAVISSELPPAVVETPSRFPSTPRPTAAGPSIPFARRVHSLTARQQQALMALVGFGARLDAGFTRAQLRSSYRALARTHHPDRHTTATVVGRTHHEHTFARIAEHYRCLAGVFGEDT
jgi:hypothetical protein